MHQVQNAVVKKSKAEIRVAKNGDEFINLDKPKQVFTADDLTLGAVLGNIENLPGKEAK